MLKGTTYILYLCAFLLSCENKNNIPNNRETWNDTEYQDSAIAILDSSIADTTTIVSDSLAIDSLNNALVINNDSIISQEDTLKNYSLSKICSLISTDSLLITNYHSSFSLILDSLCFSDTSSVYYDCYKTMITQDHKWKDTLGKKTINFIECSRANFTSFIESLDPEIIGSIAKVVGNRLYIIEQDKVNYSTSKQWLDAFYIKLNRESSEKLLLFCDMAQKSLITHSNHP